MTEEKREISAGMIIYRRTKEGPKFLLLYSGGSYWNFPKGKLNEGEKNFKAALREVEEETGLSIRDLQFRSWFRVADHFTYVRDRQKIRKTVTYYLAETKKAEVKLKIVPPNHQGERHEGYGWFALKEALKVVRAPNLKRHVKSAYDTVVHRKSTHSHDQNSPRQGRNIPKAGPTTA
ncbi:MAG: NUDIX domain-containing protein [Candidatus Brennerbacteria bacterium]